MGKLDELMKAASGNASESMGAGRSKGGAAMHRASVPEAPPTPTRLQGVTRSRNAAEIAVDKIVPDPDQPREEFDPEGLQRLAESLATRGQLQPIRVRWDEGQGRYVLICGERRWRAARLAGMATISATIFEGELSSEETLAVQLIENCLREDLQPIEQARAYKQLMARNGWSARQVARELSIAQSNVVRALALLDLPDSVQDQVEQGVLPPATAYEVSKIDDRAEQEALANLVVREKLTRQETVAAVRERKARKGGTAGAPSRRSAPPSTFEYEVAEGIVVKVSYAAEMSLGPVEALERALELARARREVA